MNEEKSQKKSSLSIADLDGGDGFSPFECGRTERGTVDYANGIAFWTDDSIGKKKNDDNFNKLLERVEPLLVGVLFVLAAFALAAILTVGK